jgi:hypothetical protein
VGAQFVFLPDHRQFRGIVSSFPQSRPQIKVSHKLLIPRLFQFTLNLSFGGRWPDLCEGWLEKLTIHNQTDVLTECVKFKASKSFFYAFLSHYFAYVYLVF